MHSSHAFTYTLHTTTSIFALHGGDVGIHTSKVRGLFDGTSLQQIDLCVGVSQLLFTDTGTSNRSTAT